ncbi:MBL fold metallo-hydrolase [Aquibaculum sediminis]|uniref:MBL fold metallo-hydrolase n=1 Tax=Aquibaculum sediminis TaxID=3231907 RepID=UPI003455EFA3
MRIATAESWYETRRLPDGLTWIYEPHIKPFYRCNIWHLRGRERDLLIDSGSGLVSLRRQVALLAERPLLAVATHTHFDHIGSHHEFAERAVHPAEAALLARPERKATLADPYATKEMFDALPPGGWDEAAYRITPAPATRLLEEGSVIDLGDRRFEVLHLPGHSPGSIALWEAASGILFSGDTIYDGPLVDDCRGAELAAYRRSLERLLALPVRVVHGGHFPSFGRERLRALTRAWLEGRPPPEAAAGS